MTDSEQRQWYNRGWRYSSGANATLEHGDGIGAPDAWYDGYLDYARGSAKWIAENDTRRHYAP